MTNKEAARIAIECIQAQMKRYAVDANIAMQVAWNAAPSQQTALEIYKRYAAALKFYESVLAQGEMKI